MRTSPVGHSTRCERHHPRRRGLPRPSGPRLADRWRTWPTSWPVTRGSATRRAPLRSGAGAKRRRNDSSTPGADLRPHPGRTHRPQPHDGVAQAALSRRRRPVHHGARQLRAVFNIVVVAPLTPAAARRATRRRASGPSGAWGSAGPRRQRGNRRRQLHRRRRPQHAHRRGRHGQVAERDTDAQRRPGRQRSGGADRGVASADAKAAVPSARPAENVGRRAAFRVWSILSWAITENVDGQPPAAVLVCPNAESI